MPITSIDAITYANQNTNVASTKKSEYDTRVQKQSFTAVEESLKKEILVDDIDDVGIDKPVDEQRDHERQEAEEQNREKETEIKLGLKKATNSDKKEELDTTFHILNIKV